ncbi:MAG TPA: chromosome segregation protein SMC [Allosphingosinicella sp.]|uniref:chromosome segregation protein SMC n=1 Tax=Allosphingosinicella sp. TaxID=2823234 RepID=UPI002F277FD6
MRIKRIKLSGFKSFVEPAELRIEPGLTGVVGPNGCGKSNVLEAIRWVMGESSPKSMRGAGMDDVIFAGTATRPCRDFAEVSMLLEGDGGELSGDLQVAGAGEVEVTRRIERGAGSAYRVNGRDVRARDVALLFADAATGAHSPALVSQGKIAQVISARPTERRQMLEEAAGIAGLHVRRKDAEGKLRATEANLARLDELIADMEVRASALKRQAKAAERYRRLSEQIRAAEGRLIFTRWRDASRAADAAKQEAELAAAAVERTAEAQRNAAATHADAAGALADLRSAAQAAREQATSLAHRLATLETEHETIGRRIRELADGRAALLADRAREAALADDARAALSRLEEERSAIAARLAEAEASRATIASRSVALENAWREAEAALGRARVSHAAEQAEARISAGALDAAQSKHARAGTEVARLHSQLAELGDEAPLTEARLTARAKRQAAETRLAAATEASAQAERARASAAVERDRSESDVAAARAALTALEAEARALLKAVQNGGTQLRALDQVKAAPGYERALAAALGDDLEAAIASEGARRWSGGELQSGDPPLPLCVEPLADHVEAPPALARRLAQIGVVETDDGSILLAAGQRLVTYAGSLRRWDGFVATGQGAAAAERLIRVNRLAEIELALPQATAELAAEQERSATAASAMAAAVQAGQAASREEAQASALIREAMREEDNAAIALERLQLRRTGMTERVCHAEVDLADAERALAAAEERVRGLSDARLTEANVAGLRAAAEQAGRALAEVRAEAATHARAVDADKQRADAAAKESADWAVRATQAARRHSDLGRRIASAEEEVDRLAELPAALSAEIERVAREAEESAGSAEAGLAAERVSEAELRQSQTRLGDAGEALALAREVRAGALARAENQEMRRIEMGRIAGERFECPPPLLPGKLGFDESSLRAVAEESAALDRLAADRERIGPVNLVAERELAELEEGRASIAAERDELGLAINRLRGSIGSLNREGRARLLAAFEAVNGHFRSLFTTLFEGGQARLELVESDDPLEAGLEILAQPPGKRLATLTLLSGGEQALTAIALIFALFLTNPAPICVLDEVDAPLDDANIERFCDLLDRMTGETDTRYLIVTHNAVTMSRMHRLFGVTMIERGVSRLVSVDLGGAEQLLAAE